jgi:hypothetical protein
MLHTLLNVCSDEGAGVAEKVQCLGPYVVVVQLTQGFALKKLQLHYHNKQLRQ